MSGMLADPAAARHVAALAAWRCRSFEDQWLAMSGDDPAFMPAQEPARGRIRLGLFCPCLGLGGAEAWQLSLIRAIDPATVVWRGAVVTEGRLSVAPAMLGELASQMPVGFGLNAARVLAQSVDVIISWSVLNHDALFHGLDTPPRVVLACHFPGEMPWTAAAEQLLARVDRLVAVSELAVESLPVSLQGSAAVIWNAVDPERLKPTCTPAATRQGWGLPANAKVAGFLGRLAPEKDPDAMLRLAEELPPPWHVVIVGNGGQRAALAAKIARLGLDRVRLVAGMTSVGDVLAAFDTLIVPSRFESFGLTMAEGFWSRVPVVATRSGLAKLVPGLVREVGFVPSGAELARAILFDHNLEPAARLARVEHAHLFARYRLDLARFGADWTRLIRSFGTQPNPETDRQEELCRSTAQVA